MAEINFLNIDLDIESRSDISPIINEWDSKVSVMRNDKIDGIYYGSFETSCSGVSEIIEEYVSLVNNLSPEARIIWDGASKRDFDFGYESGEAPNNFHSRISAKLIAKLAKINGSISVTIYPIDRGDNSTLLEG